MASFTELRAWATETFGAHSHKETQILAALGPLDEWLSHLARQGVALELRPVGAATFVPKPETSGPASGYVTGENEADPAPAGVQAADSPESDPSLGPSATTTVGHEEHPSDASWSSSQSANS